MSNALRDSIHQMAADFASSVLRAIRGASLEDILTESQPGQSQPGLAAPSAPRRGPGRPRSASAEPVAPSSHATPVTRVATAPQRAPRKAGRPARAGRDGRLGRRSPSDIANVVTRIVGLLDSHPTGLRAEQIRQTLGLQSKELPRPIAEALESNKISKVGEKRATTYFAGRRGPAAGKGAKPGKGAAPANAVKRGGKRRGRNAGDAAN